jgi:hypothetical protein
MPPQPFTPKPSSPLVKPHSLRAETHTCIQPQPPHPCRASGRRRQQAARRLLRRQGTPQRHPTISAFAPRPLTRRWRERCPVSIIPSDSRPTRTSPRPPPTQHPPPLAPRTPDTSTFRRLHRRGPNRVPPTQAPTTRHCPFVGLRLTGAVAVARRVTPSSSS